MSRLDGGQLVAVIIIVAVLAASTICSVVHSIASAFSRDGKCCRDDSEGEQAS